MLRPFRSVLPKVHRTAYIDQSAQVIGDVEIGEESSVWMNVVIRGDVNTIPSAEDVAAFVGDTSPDAYAKVVAKFLASPHYGEHRARYWLDAARYGDTNGLHYDNYRGGIWPYRDWVVKAFNGNMPFDRFTVEQLAGDLLPDPDA